MLILAEKIPSNCAKCGKQHTLPKVTMHVPDEYKNFFMGYEMSSLCCHCTPVKRVTHSELERHTKFCRNDFENTVTSLLSLQGQLNGDFVLLYKEL